MEEEEEEEEEEENLKKTRSRRKKIIFSFLHANVAKLADANRSTVLL
jgi:hypothetical protein